MYPATDRGKSYVCVCADKRGRHHGDESDGRDESCSACCHWFMRRYKCKQMAITGIKQAETAGGGQSSERASERVRRHRDYRICRPTVRRIGLVSLHLIPTEINEGETRVSEIISEIRHGSQSECEV